MKMEVGAVVQDRATGGDADRTTQIAPEIEETGRELQLHGFEAAQCQGNDWSNGELLGEAAESLWEEKLLPTPVMRDWCKGKHAEAEQTEAEHHQPSEVNTLGAECVDRNRHDLKDACRENGASDLKRAEAAHA